MCDKAKEIAETLKKQPPMRQVDAVVRTPTVTVCASCLQASCWKGEFMCEEARFAGTIEKTIEELKALGYENSGYWEAA